MIPRVGKDRSLHVSFQDMVTFPRMYPTDFPALSLALPSTSRRQRDGTTHRTHSITSDRMDTEKSEDDPRVELLVETTRKIRTKKKPWALGIRRPNGVLEKTLATGWRSGAEAKAVCADDFLTSRHSDEKEKWNRRLWQQSQGKQL